MEESLVRIPSIKIHLTYYKALFAALTVLLIGLDANVAYADNVSTWMKTQHVHVNAARGDARISAVCESQYEADTKEILMHGELHVSKVGISGNAYGSLVCQLYDENRNLIHELNRELTAGATLSGLNHKHGGVRDLRAPCSKKCYVVAYWDLSDQNIFGEVSNAVQEINQAVKEGAINAIKEKFGELVIAAVGGG